MSCVSQNTVSQNTVYLREQMQMAEEAIQKIYRDFYGSRKLTKDDLIQNIYHDPASADAMKWAQFVYDLAAKGLKGINM
jgi:hypothetical protein